MIWVITRKQPGKAPSKDHKKGLNEGQHKKSKVTCSKYGISGYTKKTCPEFTYHN